MIVTQTNPKQPINQNDQEQVVKLLQQFDHAWNVHDMDSFSKLLTEDCQWVNVVGMWWNGKEAVTRAHLAFHKTIFHDVNIATKELSLRNLAPGLIGAIVISHMDHYKTPDGNTVPDGDYRLSMTFKKQDGRWLIAGAQNTPINAMAARFDPGAPKVGG